MHLERTKELDHAKADPIQLRKTAHADGLAVAGPADHPMIAMPFHAEVDGRQYRGRGISLVRAEISGLMDPHASGTERIAWVVFRFNGFTVALTIEVRMEAVDAEAGTATLVFTDPLGEHLPQLRHLMNAFIAGDLVTMGNALSVGVASGVGAKPKAPTERGFAPFLRRLVGTTGIVVLSGLLVTLAAEKIFQRAYTATLPTPAVAGYEGRTLAATATGQIEFLNTDAKAGEVAFAIRANSGQTLSVAMPCDCRVDSLGLEAGSTVFAGDPILRLSAPDAALILTGYVPVDQALALAGADHLELRFADGMRIDASLVPGSIATTTAGDLMPYRLLPRAPLPEARLGQLAEVTVHHPVPALLLPVAGLSTVLSHASEALIP